MYELNALNKIQLTDYRAKPNTIYTIIYLLSISYNWIPKKLKK